MTILSTTWPVARKQHVCEACRHPIQPKTKYFRQTQIWEGELMCWRAHLDCASVTKELWHNAGLGCDEGVDLLEEWSCYQDEMREWLKKDYPEVLERLEAGE